MRPLGRDIKVEADRMRIPIVALCLRKDVTQRY